ncbi:MAG TPA: VWA domain-containing protein [Terriglobia bacterium]|nr:VWA domain-containing protein [Terriglobia bacterium]
MYSSAVNRIVMALLLLGAQETLRVKVSLVTVGVRVTDWLGRDARGLDVQDFSVFDDGIAQKIVFFSSEQQPVTLGILLDRSDSMSYNEKLQRAKEAAHALVVSAREGSEYFYLTFDDRVKVEADLTMDQHRIDSAIAGTSPGGGTALYDAVLEGLAVTRRGQQPRQAVVIISDGADQNSMHTLQEVIRAVREAELQVYTIGYFSKEEEMLFRRSAAKLTLDDGRVVDNPQHVLQRLAKDSGGESFFPRSDKELAQAVDKIANDLRTQYTLAFYPQSSDNDSHYHQLRVALRGGRYRVRARPGYSATSFN